MLQIKLNISPNRMVIHSLLRSGHSNGTTWQQWFYKISDFGIINLLIGGYGLDQSILKFEKRVFSK